MQVTTKITVDMTRQNVGQRVNAVQGDGNTRLVEITLLSGGQPWTPPDGVEAAIAYMQPGGTKGLYNKLADGTAAISISGNVAMVILAPQMLAVSGTVQASLVFNDAALNRLTTFPFAVSVTSNPAAGAQKTEDYIRLQWLEDKLDEYLRKAADSGAFDGAPGADGHTPEYGVDYGTPEQIADVAKKAAGILTDDIQKISDDKVDKVEGKGLSSNDYDNAAKAKVDAIPEDPKYTDTVYDDTEVKRGLSQIKDDLSNKLPKSPANWEPWTAEEQAAARERMSAEKALSGNVVFDETITESVAVMKIPVPEGWNNILLRVLYPKSGDEYAGGVSTGNVFVTSGRTNTPYDLYVIGNSMRAPTYPGRGLFFDINLIKRGAYAELNRYIAGMNGQQNGFDYSVLSSQCAYSYVKVITFRCDHIPAGTQFILYVD